MTGLVASVGEGSGKQVAKIASGLAKPDGIPVISATRDTFCRRAAGSWALGIGPVAEERLRRLGIEPVGGFAALSDAEAANMLGGPSAWRTAGPGDR